MLYNKTEISKKVGTDSNILSPPDLQVVEVLFEKAKQGDYNSAISIFRYYRFSRSGQNDNEIKSIDLLYEAFRTLFE
jgi:hypothetical protein